jgi:hypothetical protein
MAACQTIFVSNCANLACFFNKSIQFYNKLVLEHNLTGTLKNFYV